MVSKIIKNGIDVSRCGFYHKDTGEDCHIVLAFSDEHVDADHTYFKCEQNPNCLYKQLARKTKECEKKSWEIGNLGYKIKNQRKEINERLKQLQVEMQNVQTLKADLKQVQNENLKEIVELIRKNGLENNVVFQLLDIENKNKDKYKQSLEEIKGLAQSINDEFENDNIEQQLHYCKEIAAQIVQRCEVET